MTTSVQEGPAPPSASNQTNRTEPHLATGRSPARFEHIKALDGLRGFAVVLVVLSHFLPETAAGGFLGVDLFFVLSGFLITSLLMSERESTDRVSLGNFWLRRARRLFPALLAVVSAVLVVTWVMGPEDRTHRVAADGLASLLYVANWRFVISGQSYIRQFLDEAPSPLQHTWSLAIEEQFYILWPLVFIGICALAVRFGNKTPKPGRPMRWWVTGASLLAAGASFAWMVFLHARGTDLDRLYYGTDTRVFAILIGAALGAATAGRPALPASNRVGRVLLITTGSLGAASLVLAMFTVTTDQDWLYAGGLGAIAMVLLVVLAAVAQADPNPLAVVFRWRPLVGLGWISYGVYLWHWPITVWLDESSTGLQGWLLFGVRCAATLAVSLVSYRFLEQPIRQGRLPHFGPLSTPMTAALVIAGVLVSLAIPVMIYPGLAQTPESAQASVAPEVTTSAYERAVRCEDLPEPSPIRTDRRLTVDLEGNSIAGEVAPCIEAILDNAGADMEQHTADYLVCRELPAISERLADPDQRPDAVIAFMFTAYDGRCGKPWHAAIDEFVDLYREAGVHVYLVPTVPIVEGGRDDLAPGPILEYEHYREMAERYPDEVTFVDGGVFLRDTTGEYQWRMPCLSTGEPGCDDNDEVVVRFTDGVHFCSDPAFPKGKCADPVFQGGQNRAAAGIMDTVLPDMRRRFAAS